MSTDFNNDTPTPQIARAGKQNIDQLENEAKAFKAYCDEFFANMPPSREEILAKAKATRNDALAQRVKAVRAKLPPRPKVAVSDSERALKAKGVHIFIARTIDERHPLLPLARDLKRFADLRQDKIAAQTNATPEHRRQKLTAGDHLVLSKKAASLHTRLSDPAEIQAYLKELRQKADAHVAEHQRLMAESKAFWYGPAGLRWWANKKKLTTAELAIYAELVDDATRTALAELVAEDAAAAAKRAEDEERAKKLLERLGLRR